MARHNQRFAKMPFNACDLHLPLAVHEDLRADMVSREWRSVTRALTLHYNKTKFIIEPTPVSRPLAGKRVEVCELPDGTMEILHEGTAPPYRMFDKIWQVNRAAMVKNKHLDAALLMAKPIQGQLRRASATTTSRGAEAAQQVSFLNGGNMLI